MYKLLKQYAHLGIIIEMHDEFKIVLQEKGKKPYPLSRIISQLLEAGYARRVEAWQPIIAQAIQECHCG